MPTIGVSVAVPEPWGAELQQHRLTLGDDAARWIPTHVTLLPPHETGTTDLEALVEHLDEVARSTAAFRIHLRGTGTFRPISPVVFLNVVEGISECEKLAAHVLEGPLSIERAFPYHPHVTVAHHLSEQGLDRAFAELAEYDAAFDVDKMWMYRHDDALGWQPERSFSFSG